jgi:O-antigen/teichoic acid export membrane protein
MLRLLALTSFPLLVGLIVVADLFVLTLYGPKWQPSILPLQILIIFALRQTVGSPTTVVYNVLGRPDIGFKMGLAFLPFYFLSIWLGSSYGIVGVAVGVTFARTAFGFIQFTVIARLVKQSFRQILSPLVQPLLAAIILGTLLYGCRLLFSGFDMPAAARLALLVLLGGVIWFLLLARLFPLLFEEMLRVVDLLSCSLGARIRRVVQPVLV